MTEKERDLRDRKIYLEQRGREREKIQQKREREYNTKQEREREREEEDVSERKLLRVFESQS